MTFVSYHPVLERALPMELRLLVYSWSFISFSLPSRVVSILNIIFIFPLDFIIVFLQIFAFLNNNWSNFV